FVCPTLPKMPDGLDVLTTRACSCSPDFARSRQYAAAWRVTAKCPLRWTAMTASHSSSVMFTSMRSRRIPALLTTMWRLPKADTACSTSRRAPSKSATSSPSATARPPADSISATTCCAGAMSVPSPASEPPRSLTATLAPAAASATACARPIPRPAPVTIATFPLRSATRRSLVPLEGARRVDAQARLDVGLDARERARFDVPGANAAGKLAPLGVVFRRQRVELAIDDRERIHGDEGTEAEPLVVEGGEDLAAEELGDRLGQLLCGRPLAHVANFSSRWQISYSTSAPSRPRTASSTLRSCPR